MTNAEFLQSQVEWARKWLAVPESELPGALTHAKCYQVLNEAQDALLDHARFTVTASGMRFSHYA